MGIERILVANDLSEEAAVANRAAAGLAAKHDATLFALHVISSPDEYLAVSAMHRDAITSAFDQSKDKRAGIIEKLEGQAREAGCKVEVVLETGHADETIIEVAKTKNVDLIVTGTHGRTGLKRVLLGSVAEKTVRMAECDVLVARADHGSGFQRLLVTTDFSDSSARAIEAALAVANDDADVDLLHAWQYPVGTHADSIDADGHPVGDLAEDIRGQANKTGQEWLSRYSGRGVNLTFRATFGPPSGVIQDALEDSTYDLIAMGTHGYRGFRRFILGSVAETTVRYAPCSVLVVRASPSS